MAQHDITIEQGSTFAKTITLKDDSDVVINISADTFRGQVRKLHSSTTAKAEFEVNVTDGPNGVLSWGLTSANTTAMGSGKFVYDIEWVKAGGNVVRILEGVVDATPEVTR